VLSVLFLLTQTDHKFGCILYMH